NFESTFGDRYNGELHSRVTLPWIGAQVRGERWRGMLRFSPLAHVDLEMPLEYNFVNTPYSQALIVREQNQYTFKNNGLWFAASFDYDIYAASKWRVSLWAKATWSQFKGDAIQSYHAEEFVNGVQTAAPVAPTYSSSDGTLTTNSLGAGLQVRYTF
ncbi:MAG: hypothetical protein PHN75_14905, partial [Syntrophales bacterium]|nr:hypothetical protein [Syntrophales bacterium]